MAMAAAATLTRPRLLLLLKRPALCELLRVRESEYFLLFYILTLDWMGNAPRWKLVATAIKQEVE